ncbi:LysR family transcriptional regulator [Tabrizicola sp.]|uniref:LysR family transcriptional regulator n=1 Tax=Tabrizicola sp. TaxID=2005166 RepID=UPI003F322811
MPDTSDVNRIDLNLLKTFVALIEERSTVGAARRLFLAQPTISGALMRLRETFNDELLVRNGRALEPTARALELLEAVKPHLDGLAAALSSAAPFDPATDARVFRFGCTDAVGLSALPGLTATLRQSAPNCDLVVRLGDFRTLPGMLSTGEISTAVAYMRERPPANAKMKALRHSPWVTVRDASTAPIEGLDDFCARPHVLVSPSGDLTGFVDDALAKLGRSRRIAVGIANFGLLLGVLPGSDMISVVPDFVANSLAALGGLAIDPVPVAIPLVTNTLVWRAVADRDPAERWFREVVQQAFAAAAG